MSLKLFIAGTDTDVGKTYIATGLLQLFNQHGLSTIGIKPVASGSSWQDSRLYNSDALALQKHSSIQLPYEKINPFAFEPPIAPHVAAEQVNQPLGAEILKMACLDALNHPADVHIVEGAGGWHVPLNDHETIANFVQLTNLKVIIVVGIRLGCINHAILTDEAITHSQVSKFGWIANCIDPEMLYPTETINTLKMRLKIPLLGIVNYQQDPAEALQLSFREMRSIYPESRINSDIQS